MTPIKAIPTATIYSLDSDYLSILADTAKQWTAAGASVLPVTGVHAAGSAGKVAAVAWGEFRQRVATWREIDAWYSGRGYGGLAVATGNLSRLAILDFDNPALAQQFADTLPALVETYTELSAGRGLPHYFYRPPAGERIPTIRASGVDLLGEGAYCLIAPTVIRDEVGHEAAYHSAGGGAIRQLSHEEWRLIVEFVGQHCPAGERVAAGLDEPLPHEEVAAAGVQIDAPNWLADTFRNMCSRFSGRNNALFAAARLARDCGLSESEARAALLSAFIHHNPIGQHAAETPRARQAEGQRTIASAYKRKPQSRIPNSIREKLLQTGRGQTARLLDALLLAVRPGARLAMRDVLSIGRAYGLSNQTIYRAADELRGMVKGYGIGSDGGVPPPPYGADAPGVNVLSNSNAAGSGTTLAGELFPNCPVDTVGISFNAYATGQTGKNSKTGPKPGSGQPLYIPRIDELCMILEAQDTGGDVLKIDALKSLPAYRDALEQAYVTRLNSTTARRSAQRLGTARRTAHRRLKHRIGATGQAQEPRRVLLAADNLDMLGNSESEDGRAVYAQLKRRGVYLEIVAGRQPRKAAPSRERAADALAHGAVVCLCYPMPTIYSAPPAETEAAPLDDLPIAAGAEPRQSPKTVISDARRYDHRGDVPKTPEIGHFEGVGDESPPPISIHNPFGSSRRGV